MSWKLVETKTLKPMPALVDEFATMTPAPNDRKLNNVRLGLVRKTLANGTFRTCTWASAKCKEDGNTYRVNGKHTSTIMAMMNGECPKHVRIYVERYECETLEDVAKLYATFDARWNARSAGDIYRAFSATVPELEGVSSKIIERAASGIAYAHWEQDSGHRQPDERAQFIIAEKEFILWANQIIGSTSLDGKHLLRGPTMAAMFRTWKKDHKAATRFWSDVKTGDGAPGSPVRKLERMLLSSSVDSGAGSRSGKKRVDTREMYVKCLHAWNAWRKGEATDMKYYPASKTPEVR